jgi:hypothetical protein
MKIKPRSKVIIYVLTPEDSLSLFADRYFGLAEPCVSLIIISFKTDNFTLYLRHEITHVLAWRWGWRSPEFKSEGLAVFFELIEYGDNKLEKLTLQRPNNPPALHLLLQKSFFLAETQIGLNYLTAGTFTAYLIQKFGWSAYWSFYRKAGCKNYLITFVKNFGLSLEAVEEEWLNSIPPRVVA